MANQPTIVAASLSDQDLQNSINKLVKHVEDSTNKMASSMDSAVEQMKKKLGELGNVKIDFGGTSSGSGTKKVTDDQKSLEEQTKKTTQAVKEQNLTLDQQSASLRGAMKGAVDDASNSYANLVKQIQQQAQLMDMRYTVTPIQELRMRQHELEAGMRSASDNAAKAKKDVDELNAAIASYRSTMESLPKDPQGFANRQAIQKEINDLTVLRDVAVAEQKQWTSAVARLSAEYSTVNAEINKVGQALIDEEQKEKKVTSELDRQLQKISEISSRKEATLALKSISSMESSDLDKASAKLENLKALKDKVKNTDLMSQKGMQELDSWIKYTTMLVERFTERTSRGAKEDEEAIRKAAEAEKMWADKVRQRGQVAQDTSRKIIQMLNEEAQAGGKGLMGFYKVDGKDINAVRELQNAIKDMQQQYNLMTDSEKESAVGRMLKRDIENAKAAAGAISAYNKAVLGMESSTKDAGSKSVINYESLKKVIGELTQQYQSMSIAEIKAGSANIIVDKIQRTNRELQELQNRLNRPISFEAAMRGTPKTLDDIAYKMQRLRLYRQGIDLTKPGAEDEIKRVDEALVKLQKDADKWMSKQKDMIDKNNALGRSWNYMKNRLAFYFTVGASTQFIKNLIEVRSQYEMNERALGILIDSAERGTQIFNELSQMALVSPYTLIELSTAAKQLTAYDVAAKDVVDTTRRLADMAAAVGIPIERLTYALGQIKAYGYLNSRDARMFANAGIPLVKQLSEYYTELEGKLVSTADVYDRIKKKAIDYNEVMEVINHMTDEGGKFFDFQAKMADTLKVRLANLTLAWNNMLNEMGKETQGVLTFGIGALKELFLRWKDLDKAIKGAAWIFGLKVGLDLLLFGLNRAYLALGMTTHRMAFAEVVGKRLAATLTAVGRSLYSLASSRMTWVTLVVVATIELINALNGANEAQKALNESIRNGAKDNYNNISKFLEQYKDVRESLYETRKVAIGNIYDPSSRKATATAYSEESFAKDIDNNEAKKAWEAIREQIELTTTSSDSYIQRLLSIKNMSERVRQAFNILEDIKVVNAALQELGEDTIKIEKEMSGWWNLWQMPDGLIGNLKDYSEELDVIIEKYGSVAAMKDETFLGGKGSDDLNDYQTALERFRDDLKTTTDSIINFIELKGWSGDVNKINETFKQITQKLVLDNQLDPQKAFILQTEVEEARSEAAKKALLQRINDEKAALAQTADEESRNALTKSINDNVNEYNTWNEFNGRKKVEWERFTKWLKEQHISETTAMFRNMDAEDIKSLNFQEGKHAEWVNRMVTQYAKEHKMSYDEAFNYLKSWVKSANQWSVFIPLIISTEDKKTVYEQLEEYDKVVDEADAQIERLTKRIEELRAKKELDKKETEELTKAEKELADAENSKRDAESHGGHGKKEKKDERAATKAQKQAESELQKALKEELQLIDKVRSQYKKLTDAGVSRAVAMKTVTEQFGDSIKHINAVLGRNGLPKFDIKSFAGTDNPHEMMVMLKKQIDSAKKVKNIKPEEIKDLEIKYSEIKVDAEAYDATKIKKGLDNELGRLKDEYELAVELDANPELGNMFADMFDIDLDTLPRTAKEYADAYTKSLNKYFKQMGANIELPNMLNLTRDEMMAFQQQVDDNQLQQVYFDMIQKGFDATHDALKKEISGEIKEYDKLLQKYAEYQYKLTQIAKEANNERKALVVKFGTDEQKERARKIYAQLEVEDDPQKADELKRRLIALVDQVVGDDQVKVQLKVAINKEEAEKSAKASFEEFQKSPEWIMATGNLAGLTDKALKGLIDTIDEYKKKAKNLSPKQIKEINKALVNLEKERKKNNPFKLMSISVMEAKERMEQFDEEIKNVEEEIDALSNAQDNDNMEETGKKITTLTDRLRKLKKAREEAGKIDASEIVSNVNAMVSSIGQAIQMVDGLLTALNGKKWSEAQELMNDTFSVIEKGGQGAAMGAQIGGGYGAIIGAAAGVITGLITSLSDNANKKIDAMVEESVVAVKRLELAYVDLEHAIDNAYGTGVVGSKRLLASMKQLELAELEQQLLLEQSRSYKNRDEGAIADLQKRIKELRYEISDTVTEITNDLLGSDVGSFAENLVSSMIDAFKQGEDYMKVFEEKFDDMIDNMIMKSIVSKVVAQYMDALWNDMDARISNRARQESDALAAATKRREELEAMDWNAYAMSEGLNPMGNSLSYIKDQLEQARENARAAEERARKAYEAASEMSDSDIDFLLGELADIKPQLSEKLKDILGEYYKFGEATTPELSALQQGIQGVSETTANALEAILNGMSQQVYAQTDYLRQIAEVVVSGNYVNNDIQIVSLSQILLQLQNSYQTQEAIRSILDGWSNPSGQAVRVEMI